MPLLPLNISTLLTLSILLAGIVIAKDSIATGTPIYYKESKILMIPRVDTLERASAYHGAVFSYIEETGDWHLSGPGVPLDGEISIDEATITVTDTFPTQVFLHITGKKFYCGELAQINQRLKDNIFEVRVHTDLRLCEQPLSSGELFTRVIPLSVYGLNAGVYEYIVNDDTHGTFNLLEDNMFVQ